MTDLLHQPTTPSESPSIESEAKFVVPAFRTKIALGMLQQFCSPDPKFPIGVVSSIYYDSQGWDYLREKRDSTYLKTKVRLRWYEGLTNKGGTSDASFAETKYRIGSKRMKARIPTKYSAAFLAKTKLDNTALLDVPVILAANGVPIRQAIFPAFVVRYCRNRFIDPVSGARISLDYDITAPRSNPRMLANAFPCALPKTVLEIKGTDGEFSQNLRPLLNLGFRRAAFSKYYECYGQLTRTFF